MQKTPKLEKLFPKVQVQAKCIFSCIKQVLFYLRAPPLGSDIYWACRSRSFQHKAELLLKGQEQGVVILFGERVRIQKQAFCREPTGAGRINQNQCIPQ